MTTEINLEGGMVLPSGDEPTDFVPLLLKGKPTLSIEAIRAHAEARLQHLEGELASLRDSRDRLNVRIKALVTEHEEAKRAVKALTPKTKAEK